MSDETSAKPPAGLSLDLDNLWTYLRIHGDSGWEGFPSYLQQFVPRILDLLDLLELKITFFIVGQDAALQRNRDALRQITERGHEVGNHSFSHDPWLHLLEKEEIRQEVSRTEEAISEATGHRPVGFRGPGFSWSRDLLEVLEERGYAYDATTLPTFIGPLARRYYFWKADLSQAEKEKRGQLFGTFRDGLRPLKPYRWRLSRGALLELPVTTIPVVRLPFHLSYLLYLNGASGRLVQLYLSAALGLCRMTGTALSFLLHPLDLLDSKDAPQLRFFPGMEQSAAQKKELFCRVMKSIGRQFDIRSLNAFSLEFRAQSKLPLKRVPQEVQSP